MLISTQNSKNCLVAVYLVSELLPKFQWKTFYILLTKDLKKHSDRWTLIFCLFFCTRSCVDRLWINTESLWSAQNFLDNSIARQESHLLLINHHSHSLTVPFTLLKTEAQHFPPKVRASNSLLTMMGGVEVISSDCFFHYQTFFSIKLYKLVNLVLVLRQI